MLALVFACSASLAAFAFSAEPEGYAPDALAFSVSADKSKCSGSDTLTFTVTVTNQTADEMTDVAIYASPNLRARLALSVSRFNFGNEKDAPVVVIPSLSPGETKTVTVPCKVSFPFGIRLILLILSMFTPLGGYWPPMIGGRPCVWAGTTVSVGKVFTASVTFQFAAAY